MARSHKRFVTSIGAVLAVTVGGAIVVAAIAYRPINGFGNNLLVNPEWGSTDERLLRSGPVRYADDIAEPNGGGRPGARLISNTIADQGSASIINDRMLSGMTAAWLQFIASDLTLTPDNPSEPFNIPTDPTKRPPTNFVPSRAATSRRTSYRASARFCRSTTRTSLPVRYRCGTTRTTCRTLRCLQLVTCGPTRASS
jgi:Animal haem peroxidase